MQKYTLHTQKYTCKWTSTRYTRKSTPANGQVHATHVKVDEANGQVHATYAKVHLQMEKYMLHTQKYTCKWTSTPHIFT